MDENPLKYESRIFENSSVNVLTSSQMEEILDIIWRLGNRVYEIYETTLHHPNDDFKD